MALTLKRKRADGTEEEIGAEVLWKERDELNAALAEARGFLASVLDCVDQSNIERLCRLADTISDWLEGKLAARPAPAECTCDLRNGMHRTDCNVFSARADPRPGVPMEEQKRMGTDIKRPPFDFDDPHPDIKCTCGEWDLRRPDNIKLCWMNGCPKGGEV